MKTVEQEARNLLERIGVADAQHLTSGDVVELANLLSEVRQYRKLLRLTHKRAAGKRRTKQLAHGSSTTARVIKLPCVTRLDLPVEGVLEEAKDRLEGAVVLGWDTDGDLYFASTYADGGEVLWLLEQCKLALLGIE